MRLTFATLAIAAPVALILSPTFVGSRAKSETDRSLPDFIVTAAPAYVTAGRVARTGAIPRRSATTAWSTPARRSRW